MTISWTHPHKPIRQDGALGLSKERRVRSPLHFHPSLDLCAFAYTDEDEQDEENGILGATQPLVGRDVDGVREPLEEGEVSLGLYEMEIHHHPLTNFVLSH